MTTPNREEEHREIARSKHVWRRALYKKKLPASALRVGLCLVEKFLNSRTGALFPSHAVIADECDLPEDTVKDGLKALKKAGLLHTKKSRFNGSPDYFLSVPRLTRIGENPPVRHDGKRWISTLRKGGNPPHEEVRIHHLTLERNLRR